MGGLAFNSTNFRDAFNHALPLFKDFSKFRATWPNQRYIVIDEWFTKNVFKATDGNQIEGRIIYGDNGSFRFVNLHERTPINFVDVVSKVSMPWCFAEGKITWESREADMRKGKSAIVNYIKSQTFAGLKSVYNGIEASGFGGPYDSADTKVPMGIPFWIQYLPFGTTDYDGSFNGRSVVYGDGTSSTSANVGGVDRSTISQARNWAFNKSGMNGTTIDSMLRAKVFSGFQPPRNLREFINWKAAMYRVYMSLSDYADYLKLVNAGPDNRNGDLMPFSGVINFMGMECIGLNQLEGMANEPLYMLDMNAVYPVVHENWWLKQTEPMNDREAPHENVIQIDCQYNFFCEDPRTAGAVGHSPLAA